MGVMRFLIHSDDRLSTWPELGNAYLGGADGRLFLSHVSIEGSTLELRREERESARLYVACPVAGFGRPILCTAALRERDEPYLLIVELARGTLGLIRDQLAAWQLVGMAVPDEVAASLREAQANVCRAACRQEDAVTASRAAEESLVAACRTAETLTESYVRQRLAVRRRRSPHLPVLLGCPLGTTVPGGTEEKSFAEAFTACAASVGWRAVEPVQGEYDWSVPDEQVVFAEKNRLVAVGGPLLAFGSGGFPDWAWQWGRDYYGLQCFVSDFVETAITRYAGRVRHWEIAAGANTGGALGLDEERRLALTARAVEVARQIDDELQLSLRVSRPWGEYLTAGRERLAPLQFVDALVRSGVGLTGLTLEVALGFEPGGSGYRDRFGLSRLLDLWSTLGLSLTVSLAFPSQFRRDANADETIAVTDPQWKAPWSEPAQAAWLGEVLPVLMAKPAVIGIEWSHFHDGAPHRFPHAGLLRPDGSAKPALEKLTRYRQSYWRRGRDTD